MRRPEKTSLWNPLLLCLALAGCYGTSTDTENTMTGVALLADGRPAAGAVLAIRSRELVVSPQGIPSWKALFTRTADAQGRFFEVSLPKDREIYLEIRQAPAETSPGHFPQVYFIRYGESQPRPDLLASVTLSPSGSLKGSIGSKTDPLPINCWLGVIGSSAFVKLDSASDSTGHPFRLDGLFPGSHDLTLVSVAEVGTTVMSTSDKPKGEVKPDSVTEMGSIFYNGASWATDGKN